MLAVLLAVLALVGPVNIRAAAPPASSAPRATVRSGVTPGASAPSGTARPRATVRQLAPEARRILGRWALIPWSRRDDAKVRPEGYLEFKQDLRCVLTVHRDTLSKNTYTVDTSRERWWVDIDLVRPPQTRHMLGVLEWIDENSAKFEMQWDEGGIVKHPTGFSTGPDVMVLRRVSDDGTVRVDPLVAQVVGTWDVVSWANRFEDRYKGHTTWRLGADRSFEQQGSPLWASDASGSYTLNTLKRPCWLDVTVSGRRIMGLVEYLGSALKVEMFPHPLSDDHPTQFSDVKYGTEVVGVDRNIFYLTPKEDPQSSTNTAPSPVPRVTAGAAEPPAPSPRPAHDLAAEERAATELLDRHLAAYNAKNLDTLMACYAEGYKAWVQQARPRKNTLGEDMYSLAQVRSTYAKDFAEHPGSRLVVRERKFLRDATGSLDVIELREAAPGSTGPPLFLEMMQVLYAVPHGRQLASGHYSKAPKRK